MFIPKKKVYGDSKVPECPFCGRQSTTRNWQNVPTCKDHKEMELPAMRCVCGEYLDLRVGKFGPYFNCMKCGNVNFKKGLEINGMAVGAIFEKSDLTGKQRKQVLIDKTNGSDTDEINRRIREELEAAIRGDD